MTVYGSLQCPYYVHKALVVLLKLPPDRVRVVQTETGGGFGGKEEYPSMLACHAAILARKANRPVKMIYDRVEDLLATTKRHPSIVRHRTGLTRDGRLTAMDVDVIMDGGAYATLSAVVLSRGVIHAAGPYRCDHVRIRGRAMMTHTPPNGAFRGFGAPQTQFAIEAHIDRIADQLGIDPVRLREINALRPGDTTATGQKLGKDASALPVLRDAVKRSRFAQKRKQWKGTNRGIGLSLFFHGSGFTGGGEVKLASKASLELTARGAQILVASTEIGQGTRTMHAQIVADALGVPYDAIDVHEADTAFVPDSGPTVASRTCMIVGKLLERCARDMRKRLGKLTPAQYFKKHGSFTVTSQYEPPPGLLWDDDTYAGDAYGSYAWGCNVVELEVDPVTFEVTPLNVTAVAEIGKAIHPMMAIGQIEGGTAQGIGYALIEEVVMKDGRMANAQLTNYIIPTPMDAAPMDIGIMERPYQHGPFGAKGVGEMPIDGPAPAVDQRASPLRLRYSQHSGDAGATDVRLRSPRDSQATARRAAQGEARTVMKLTINGKARTVDVHPMKRLLDVIREDCGLTGTKEGCGEGECGACTVLIDGVRRRFVHRSRGARRRLPRHHDRRRHGDANRQGAAERVRRAWRRAVRHLHARHDPGCGAAQDRARRLPEIKTALAGNLCRCTGYPAIFRSVTLGVEAARRKGRPCPSPLARCRSSGRAR